MTNPNNIPADAILRANALIVLGTYEKPVAISVIAEHFGATEAELTAAMSVGGMFHLIGDTAVLTEAGWKFYREQHGDDDGEES